MKESPAKVAQDEGAHVDAVDDKLDFLHALLNKVVEAHAGREAESLASERALRRSVHA